jgi:hypothetical protein
MSPAPGLPENWLLQQSIPQKASMGNQGQGRLQVLVAYGGPFPSHTALRLLVGQGDVVFWDPAGDYGKFDEDMQEDFGPFPIPVQRPEDILQGQVPDLLVFAKFRWALADSSLVVFEWDLPPEQTLTLQDILLHGTDDRHPAGEFRTWTFPPFCANATADFLRRFGSPTVEISDWYFWPHSLALALYAQPPSRVLVFVPDGPERIYVPPGPISAQF